MRVRDSGMPDEAVWEELFGPRCPGEAVHDLPPWCFGLVLVPEAGR